MRESWCLAAVAIFCRSGTSRPPSRSAGLLLQQLAVADDGVERRAQLVGHVGEELGLVLAGDFELAALAARSRGRAGRSGWRARTGWRTSSSRSTTSAVNSPGVSPSHDEPTDRCAPRGASGTASTARVPASEQGPAQPALVGAFRRDVRDLDRLSRHRQLADSAFAPTQARRAEQSQTGSSSALSVARGSKTSALPRRTRRSCPRRVPESWTARPTIVVSTVSQIEGGADRPPDLAEGRELLDRAGELLRPRLQLGQQARILDRDHRLIGEGLEERDLVVSEPAGFAARDGDRPDRLVVTEQRHDDLASVAEARQRGLRRRSGTIGIGLGVDDIDRCSIPNGSARASLRRLERQWEARPRRRRWPRRRCS